MRSAAGLATLVLAALLAACGDHGADKSSGEPPPADRVYGQCAFCHNDLDLRWSLTAGTRPRDQVHSAIRI